MPQQILDLFPIEDRVIKDIPRENGVVPVSERLKQVVGSLVWQKPIPSEDGTHDPAINRPGSFYRRYRSVQDLPEKARAFYNKVGKVFCDFSFTTFAINIYS